MKLEIERGDAYTNWVFRVAVSGNQAIIAFPKFFTLGIGFLNEGKDWNTNLPYTCDSEYIYNHIKCNKGDRHIHKETCLKAIQMLQEACKKEMDG